MHDTKFSVAFGNADYYSLRDSKKIAVVCHILKQNFMAEVKSFCFDLFIFILLTDIRSSGLLI